MDAVLAAASPVRPVQPVGPVPAGSRFSSSAAHPSGKYKARPIKAWPRDVAKVNVTATWHSATPPAVPLYWRVSPVQPVTAAPRPKRRLKGPLREPRCSKLPTEVTGPTCDKLVLRDAAAVSHVQAVKDDA